MSLIIGLSYCTQACLLQTVTLSRKLKAAMKDSERIVNHGKHVKAMVDDYEKENNEQEELEAAAKRVKTETKPISRPGPKDRAGPAVSAPAVVAEKALVTAPVVPALLPSS